MSSYPFYSWSLEPTISFSGVTSGVIGVPALAIDANQNTYFAAIVVGQNSIASPTVPVKYKNYNNVVVGSVNTNGTILWYRFFPELIVEANQQEVSLVIGTNNDLYVAFVTPASVQQRYNMSVTPGWCPPLYPSPTYPSGTFDIVVARINYTNTKQTVAWVVQNAQLNSTSDETAPQLAIDTTTGLLYVTYQTSGDILCYTRIGNPNIALSCFTLNGAQLWLECQTNINSAGANTNPVVTADNVGGVYVAYETTQTVSGGAIITESYPQIEMVKFQTYLTPSNTLASYSRQWVLSQNGTIHAVNPGVTSAPSVTCDGTNVYIAFLATGPVNGNYFTKAGHDLVVAKVTPTGYTPWVQQGKQFNRAPYLYGDSGVPYITTDYNLASQDVPNLLVSLQTYPETGGANIFVFKLSSSTGNNIFDVNGFNNMPLAFTSTYQTTALLPTATKNTYTQVAVRATYGALFFLLGSLVPLPFNVKTSSNADLIMLKYNLVYYYPSTNPFDFMSRYKKICNCGANCSCQGNPTVPGIPSNVVAVPAVNSALIYYTLADGGSPLIDFAYSINNGVTFTLFNTTEGGAQFTSPLTISGLTNGTVYSVQIKAINGIGTGPPSTSVSVTPGTPTLPTNVSIQPGVATAVITFTPGVYTGAPITNYKYSLDGGATFTPFSPPQTTSPLTISGLVNGTSYVVQIAPVNAVGTGPTTANLYVTPGTPTSPTSLISTPNLLSVEISFTLPNNNGSTITNYLYSLDSGATFTPSSPPHTTSPVTISGLTSGIIYNVVLRGVNGVGAGQPSAVVSATPL